MQFNQKIIKASTGAFLKKDGQQRIMTFVRLADLPYSFVQEHTKGTGQSKNLKSGQEVVWDIEKQGFRIFNYNSDNLKWLIESTILERDLLKKGE